jgi:hypothetical protein
MVSLDMARCLKSPAFMQSLFIIIKNLLCVKKCHKDIENGWKTNSFSPKAEELAAEYPIHLFSCSNKYVMTQWVLLVLYQQLLLFFTVPRFALFCLGRHAYVPSSVVCTVVYVI